jgi:hypothetical protein
MRRLLIGLGLVVMGSAPAAAQWVVHDAAVTTRNSVTAVIKEYLLNTQRQQHERIRRMAARLSVYTNLDKYAVPDAPPWQRTAPGVPVYSGAYESALRAGDGLGGAYLDLVQPVLPARAPRLDAHAGRALAARLATIDVADAANVASTDTVGRVRATGEGDERRAIIALERSVTDPSNAQSATAVLDKIGGAVLIGARQRQARMRLLNGVLEQLLVDSKRVRDTDTSAINMQLVTLRDARAVNHAFATGTGDALRSWRQP